MKTLQAFRANQRRQSDMDRQFFNSLIEGDFGNGFVLRQSLVEGDFWARCSTSCCVYRGDIRPEDIDYGRPVASSDAVGTVVLPSFLPHLANTQYFYGVRWVSATGKQEKGTEAIVRLRFDASGAWDHERPNGIDRLTAHRCGNSIEVDWAYCSLQQESAPASFMILSDKGGGDLQALTLLKELPYRADGYYHATVPAAEEDHEVLVVRAVTATGIDDGAGKTTLIQTIGVSASQAQVDFTVCF